MRTITFEIKSLLTFQLDLVEFPELSSPKQWIQKGINILKNHAPKVLRYLSRQKILANLDHYHIRLKTSKTIDDNHLKTIFKFWIQKEKMKRLVMLIIEGIILPFTPILAILPGPNVFFYVQGIKKNRCR
jgi:hypothetical protein